jgi:hypothetical protein
MMVAAAGAGRHSVAAAVIADREAEIAVVAKEREADACRLGPSRAVRQAGAQSGEFERFGGLVGMAFRRFLVGDRELLGAGRGREHEAADAHVVAGAIAAVEMEHEAGVAERQVDAGAGAPLARGRAEGGDGIDVESLRRVGGPAGDATIEDVDRAPDRLAAEQQRRRAVKHLDPVRRDRIDRHRVIGRRVGDVDRADAVDEHSDPFALEAAQDRPRCAGREGRCRDARKARQRVPELWPHLAHELGSREHLGAGQDVEVAHERRGDDDVLLGFLVDVVAVLDHLFGRRVGGLLLSCRGRGGEHRRGEQERGRLHRLLRRGTAS